MTAPEGDRPERTPPSVLRLALTRFSMRALVALGVVVAATGFVAEAVAEGIALRHAESKGASFARGVAAPLIDSGFLAGDRPDVDAFEAIMRNRLAHGSLVHVKVWADDGRVLWADDSELRGQVFTLEPAVAGLFSTAGVASSLSDLDEAENRPNRADGPLLEVYASATSAAGPVVVVETYWSATGLDSYEADVLKDLAPLALGSVLLLALLLLPLAWSLARQVDGAREQSQRYLVHALSAADLERRRIASDLHDGPVQELASAGYALAAADSVLHTDPATSQQLLDQLKLLLSESGRSLRAVLTDIYQPLLSGEGLAEAVEDLAQRAREGGVEVAVDMADLSNAPPEVVQLVYRVVREGLRNVVRHAEADHAEVTVTTTRSHVVLSVSDDGRGLSRGNAKRGHVGLRLLEDTLVDLHGSLRLGPRPGGGAVLSAEVPLVVTGPRGLVWPARDG